jgi:PAS domain S-box-containing protein
MNLQDNPGETTRLTRLHGLHILDTAREPLFDSLVRMASEACGSSMALISLIDAERQWFKADVGLGGLRETPREYAFCAHALCSDDLMEVPDARDDARFATNPFVRDEPGVRFYAGAPLVLPCGQRVGTLCVLDPHVRRLSEQQRRTLLSLAAMTTQALTMRRDLIDRTLAVRHESEDALAAKNAELADLYMNAPSGYYSLDIDGRFVRINDTALRWLGCTRDEVCGKLGIVDFLDAEGRQYFQARFPRLKRDGRIFDIEYDLIGRSGQRRRVLGSASAVNGPDGKFLMTRTVVHDISELHRTRENLRRLGVEQQAIIDTDLVGIVKLKDRKVVWANKGAERMFGWSLMEIVGQSTRASFTDDAAYEEFGTVAYNALRSGGTHRCQVTMHRKDGSLLTVDNSITAMPGIAGEALCVLQDITELKRAEEIRIRSNAMEAENRQLLEAARVKGVFLSNMSHEFYTPLNAIIGFSHLLGTGAIPAESPRFAKYLGDIGAAGQQLLAQVQSVLAFTDAESSRFELRPQRVELRDVLQNVVDVVQAQARERGVAVTLAMAPVSLEIVIDPMRLSQVVSHTLSNAVRFSHADGHVTLRAWAKGDDEFQVEVEDCGIGIAADAMPRLFLPFRQASEGLARTHQGTGLGLALTRRLVQAQGGTVEVTSTPDVGSVFSFTLPRVQRDVPFARLDEPSS